APTFTALADQTVQENADFSLQLQAQDPDAGQTLTYALQGTGPSGLTLSSAGLVQWHPTFTQGPSTNTITFTAADNGSPSLSVTGSVRIIVTDVNRAPTFTALADQTVQENADFSLQLQAQDPDAGQTLTYALPRPNALPLSLSSAGLVQWHPTFAQGPSTNTITF